MFFVVILTVCDFPRSLKSSPLPTPYPPGDALPTLNADLCGLFDLDGSLLDSEGHKDEAHREAVSCFGGSLPDHFVRPVGASFETSCLTAINAAGLDLTFPDYATTYREIYRECRRGQVLVPGARRLLKTLRDFDVRKALVTSSTEQDMLHAITTTGIEHYFAAKVSANDVQRHKPHPEPYLLSMAHLGATPRHCFALEDTETGVASAAAAGVRVCAVRHRHNQGHDFSRAFAVLDSLEDTDYVVQMLLAAAGRL